MKARTQGPLWALERAGLVLLRSALMLAVFSCTATGTPATLPTPALENTGHPANAAAARGRGAAGKALPTCFGRVTSAGGAVAGAAVAVSVPGAEGDGFFETTLSGPSGEFSVHVPPGSGYVISAHHGRWGTSVHAALNTANDAAPLELQLERPDSSTAGVLRDERGQPIAGGQIELYLSSGSAGARAFVVAVTDAEGRFELGVPRDSYAIVARFQKQATEAASFALPSAQGLSLRLFLEGPSDAPPSPAEVQFVRAHRRPLAEGGVWTEAWLKGAEVVGIGEQTHGARELISARFELAKSLQTRTRAYPPRPARLPSAQCS